MLLLRQADVYCHFVQCDHNFRTCSQGRRKIVVRRGGGCTRLPSQIRWCVPEPGVDLDFSGGDGQLTIDFWHQHDSIYHLVWHIRNGSRMQNVGGRPILHLPPSPLTAPGLNLQAYTVWGYRMQSGNPLLNFLLQALQCKQKFFL